MFSMLVPTTVLLILTLGCDSNNNNNIHSIRFVNAFVPQQTLSTTRHLRSSSAKLYLADSPTVQKKTVFIDGEAGTTGIQVRDRLGKRNDIEILSIPDDLRKDVDTRKQYINKADAVILCTYFIIIVSCFFWPMGWEGTNNCQ